MTRLQMQLNQAEQEGLSIVDEDGVDFISDEENADLHQQRLDNEVVYMADGDECI